jgi:hypothetical protein
MTNKTLNVQLNDKVVGLTRLDKAQRMISLQSAFFNVIGCSFQTFFTASKFAELCSVGLLLCYVCYIVFLKPCR